MLRFKVLNATDPPYPTRTGKVMTHASVRGRASATFDEIESRSCCRVGKIACAHGRAAQPQIAILPTRSADPGGPGARDYEFAERRSGAPLPTLRVCFLGLAILVSGFAAEPSAYAQSVGDQSVQVPGFWDPRRRPERPDLNRVVVIRFLTEIDYPPFNFAGPDGNPQGVNVDLARMLCEELKLACTIQMRRFETLLAALNENRGDGVIASIAVTPEMRAKVDFSDPYYRTPGRFVARRDSPIDNPLPEKLEGKKVAVVGGTAHEAYLKALFTEAELHPYPSAEVARLALRQGDVDLLFGD